MAQRGPASPSSGSIADALLELMRERGGLVTGEDLETYRADWSPPVEVGYLGAHVFTRADLSGLPETLPRVPRLRGLAEAERAVALAETLDGERTDGGGDTTNITVVDAEGNACVLTTSLGLGSGGYLPDLHPALNHSARRCDS